jgi:hypothetical protein
MLEFAAPALAAAIPADRVAMLRGWHTEIATSEGVNAYSEDLVAGRSVEREGVGSFTYCLPDVLIDRRGDIRLTEVNTSNGAVTFPHQADLPRVMHMVDALLGRGKELSDGSVVLVPRSQDTPSHPEIRLRAAHFAAALHQVTGIATHVVYTAGADLPESGIVVVSDTIPQLAPLLARTGATLWFRGREVVFFNNQNLVAAIARNERSHLNQVFAELDPAILHEGTLMGSIGMNKGLQQELAAGTGIVPIETQRGGGLDDTIQLAYEMAQTFGGAVVKPDAASGGTSVIMVDKIHDRDTIRTMIAAGADQMAKKYGAGWEDTCPIRVYEFVDALPAVRADGAAFRWDMRFEVLARPDATVITPLIARTCPDPIGPVITQGSAVTNLTGRPKGGNERLSASQLLARTGLDEELFERVADGLQAWTSNALAVAEVPA